MEQHPLAPLPAIWLLAILTLAANPVAAQSSDKDAAQRELRSIERALEIDRDRQRRLEEQSETLGGEIDKVSREMVAVARAVQQGEAEATALEAELAQLSAQEEETSGRLEERREQLMGTIGALERMAQRPPEALIAMPATPVDTLRSALLLRAVVPDLQRDARQLREDIATLGEVRSQTEEKRTSLEAVLIDLKAKRTELASLHRQKNLMRDRAEAERRDVARRLTRMGREATDLQDLLQRLEEERKAAEAEARQRAAEAARRRAEEERRRSADAARRLNEASRQAALRSAPPPEVEPATLRPEPPPSETRPPRPEIAPAKGSLRLPAQGRIVSSFGDGSDPRSRGITIAARPGAQVVAPYDGRVAYAGPFRGYGLLLIIAHGGGYHSLLTGLSRLDSTPGQQVLAGEPVGVMETSESEETRLYVELRHNGQPINPIPWLTARRG